MAVFNDLKLDRKYLINEFDGDAVILVEPIMKTDFCLLLLIHEDVETILWKRLSDEIFDIIEEFSDETSNEYDLLFDEVGNIEIEP
jgi:hypothetical protein